LSSDYEQEVATIFTSSTFSFGALDEDAEVAADDELDDELDCSTVPVISTLWPTCGVSFASLASRRYSVAARLAVPDVPAVLLGLLFTLVRMNFGSLELGIVEPLVPVGAAAARCTQPVTVMALSLLCDVRGV